MKQLHRYYLFSFMHDMVLFSAVLVPFFTDWGGLSLFEIQLLQSWFMLWIFLLELPTGAVADYFGRKVSLGIGSLVAVLATILYTTKPELGYFLVAEMTFALGISLISGAGEAWVYDTLKDEGKEEEAKKALGRVRSFHFGGIMIGSLIGGVLAARFGVISPMQLTAIPFALAAMVAFSLKEPKSHSGPKESQRYITVVKDGFDYFRKHAGLRNLTINLIFTHAAAYFVIWFYQPLLRDVGVDVKYFGVIHASFVMFEIIILNNFVAFDAWIKEVSKKLKYGFNYRQITAVLVSLGFLSVVVWQSVATIFLFLALAGGFGLTRKTYISAQMQPLIPSNKRATVLSSVSMFDRMSLMILNPIVGYLATQSMSGALFLLAALPLVSLFLETKIRR